MTTRRRAREIVVQLLYEDDLNPEQDHEVAERFLTTRLHGNKPLVNFGRELWREVIKNRWDLDKAIGAKAANWSLRRMAAIDRNILRLGAYEILMTDTPGRVAINEAVELAKRYGDKQSGQFVNGILDRILNEAESPRADASQADDALDAAPLDAFSSDLAAPSDLAAGESDTDDGSDAHELDLPETTATSSE